MHLIIESTKTTGGNVGNGIYPSSIVIRDKGEGEDYRYVVHEKIYPYDRPDTNNAPFYSHGNYCDTMSEAKEHYARRCKDRNVK